LIIGVTGGLGSLISEILKFSGANVDGIGSQIEWLNQSNLNKYYNYKNNNYKNEMSRDRKSYDFVFDAADGKRYN